VKSQGYQWLEDAKVVYRELPFIYRQDDYLIHGIIDTLFQRQDGSWVIMDYKTSSVVNKQDKKQKPSPNDLESHARRYHLQLGVYAEATIAQLSGIIPETYIHYIRYNQLVEVSTDEWRSALARSLSERIVDLI
jgi:ATP-dependent exoDNAse (exonuclease V) beta subunit